MSKKFKTIITTAGAEKLAAATVPGGKKVNLTAMAVGDGGGTLPEPDAGQTKLINEVWRHALNKVSQDNKNKNYIVAELVIPPDVGGFWMRELGLYDDAGTLIAVANMAESYKPKLAEGSGRAQTCRMVIIVSNVDSVALSIDATTVMATQDYVDDKIAEHEKSRNHPDATLNEKGFTQLSSATDSTSETLAATPKAVKAAYDLADGKYTAQDASTAQKGIVKLSSATDSESELLAATPKAVKAANDNANGRVPSGRKVNGKALTGDINITSADVGALPITGGTINGPLGIGTANALGGNSIVLGDNDTGLKQEGDGILNVYANSAHVFRFISSLIESMKPLKVNGNCIATGEVQSGNGSARLAADGNIYGSIWGNRWLRDYLIATFQPKGNFTPAGQAYTKAESDARYVQNIRVSAPQERKFWDGAGWSSNDSAFATAIWMVGGSSNVGGLYVRYLQKNINGTWINVTA